jgi:uncharacterized protein DUF5681
VGGLRSGENPEQADYRLIAVREGERVLTMPAIQVVLRNQVALAAKGNGPAQRAILETVQAIERELVAQAAIKHKAEADKRPTSDLDAARRTRRCSFAPAPVLSGRGPAGAGQVGRRSPREENRIAAVTVHPP